ncbi:DUF4998 domain-containing protein [Maribacter ulvicola]|uniref:DUF4998 domain-containing protein n=1 Tax=Maribacter ulvicola TaxID=228959 RepID=A0A1N6YAB5_9FLAO|nr:DUF4998 domain-containing protein [Maribacter ulvicola]SIR11510.1 protein of unknown function [Maribacter ulvicola]
MKDNRKKIILGICSLMILGMISIACEDSYEQHLEYIENGEIIYPTKVNNLKSLTGNNRVKIVGTLKNAFNVKKVVVTWGALEEEKQTYEYVRSEEEIDTLNLIVDNLGENVYTLQVFTMDGKNNTSLKTTIVERIYGSIYAENLIPRDVISIEIKTEDLVVLTFKSQDDSRLTRHTNIVYYNTSGEEVSKTISEEEDTISLDSIDVNSALTYRTYYVPTADDFEGNKTAIDSFPSPWKELTLPDEFENVLNK